ncbi:MAG: hypothetical protein JWQ89_3191 [Devosia sp.]|nr:hypothetical protein [Devosia sp.]
MTQKLCPLKGEQCRHCGARYVCLKTPHRPTQPVKAVRSPTAILQEINYAPLAGGETT